MMQRVRVKTSCFARIAGFHPAGKGEGLGGLHQPRFAQPIILLYRVREHARDEHVPAGGELMYQPCPCIPGRACNKNFHNNTLSEFILFNLFF
jgi:hypothetical protein